MIRIVDDIYRCEVKCFLSLSKCEEREKLNMDFRISTENKLTTMLYLVLILSLVFLNYTALEKVVKYYQYHFTLAVS